MTVYYEFHRILQKDLELQTIFKILIKKNKISTRCQEQYLLFKGLFQIIHFCTSLHQNNYIMAHFFFLWKESQVLQVDLVPAHPRFVKFVHIGLNFESLLFMYFPMPLLSPLGDGCALYINNLDLTLHKDGLCSVGLNITLWL